METLKKSNIETDSFDRELFSDCVWASKELSGLIESGSTLLPGFGFLVGDIFAAFYKYNVLMFPEEEVERSALFGRKVLLKALAHPEYGSLRDETVLNAYNASLATLTFGKRLLSWIKSDDGLSESSLMDQWKLQNEEDKLNELREENETWREMAERDGVEDDLEEQIEKGKDENEQEMRRQESVVKDLREKVSKKLDDKDIKLSKLTNSSLNELSDKIEESEKDILNWGSSLGTPYEKSFGEKLDLAERLSGNEKLKKLAVLVGELKEEMFKTRRKAWSSRGSEVFDISRGDELGYVVPAELVSLRNAALKRDFLKRYVEKQLLRYSLKEEKAAGPFVVCLDGSSSMAGEKELWSKALCIALLEFAKRKKRKFSVVVFSSAGSELKVFSSSARHSWGMTESDLLEMGSYFPGGGTDFELPLQKALELLQQAEFKGGDIVFLTDGESSVREPWLKQFLENKESIGFKIFSILIDLTGRESTTTLEKFSDKVTTVSNLQSKDAKKIFIGLS